MHIYTVASGVAAILRLARTRKGMEVRMVIKHVPRLNNDTWVEYNIDHIMR
jgi:hypothetical protein